MSRKKINIHFTGSNRLDLSRGKNGEYNNQILNFFDKHNFNITSSNEAELYLFINFSRRAYKLLRKTEKNINHYILLRMEPESVYPAQYKHGITSKFGLIITIGKKKEEDNNYFSVGHPYTYLDNPNLQMSRGIDVKRVLESSQFDNLFEVENWLKRPIILSLIASNKVSAKNNSNYDLRRTLAKKIDPKLLEIYGELWNNDYWLKLKHRIGVLIHSLRNLTFPRIKSVFGNMFTIYPNYKGKLKSKHEIVKKSQFSLVIENSNTYISEKIFDAMMNGSIPIYFGPNLDQFGIPAKKLVLLQNPSVERIKNQISAVTKDEIETYLNNIRDYLHSDQFISNWTEMCVYDKIVKKVVRHYEQRLKN